MSAYTVKNDPWSSHSKLVRWIESIPALKIVVDVGIADGILGKLLKQRDYRLVGIEVNEIWANSAKPFYDQIINDDINKVACDIFNDTDCLILADVLEHLPEPKETLERIIKCLPARSVVLISVPNIANIWIRINLLFGKFDYSERGILDHTHLRFFTRKTFLSMLTNSGLVIEEETFTPIPINLVFPKLASNLIGRRIHHLLDSLACFFPALFSYQLMAKCRKEDI